MRLSLRVLLAAAAVATPVVTATPSEAYPCVVWQSHVIYDGPYGRITVPAPTIIDLDC